MARYGLICLALGLFVMVADDCQAQMRIGHQLVQRPFRALGHGSGPGIHHCNPGPDVSYYNPWSHKNSFLISRSPEYLNRFGHEAQRSPMSLLYSSGSAYSHQPNPTNSLQSSAVPITADFVPSTPKPADTDTDTEKVEDRFDEEVDKMEDAGGFDSLEEEAGDSQDSPSNNDDSQGAASDQDGTTASAGASLLHPGGVFLPVSQPVFGNGK
jgi:hypothetical protein